MEKENTKKRLLWKDLETKNVELKLSLLSNHLEVVQLFINELLEEEVIQRAGLRYQRKGEEYGYSRWSSNPGSVNAQRPRGLRHTPMNSPTRFHSADDALLRERLASAPANSRSSSVAAESVPAQTT